MAVALRGFDEVERFIGALDKKLSNYDVLLKKIGHRITHEAIPDHFKNKKSPDDKPWPVLSKNYADYKAEKKGSLDILIWNGKLKDSVDYKVHNIRLFIGAGNEDVPYARIHDLGGKAGRNRKVKIPQRNFIGIGDKEEHIIEDTIKWWVSKK
ncbi:MAG: phage virion morphogenesis protein [Spirochaetes bacterium]|nr:phage virion morphogenesis protein [Spirochaetota bacterium]